MPGDLTEQERDLLVPVLQDMPVAHQVAYIRHLYRLADDVPIYDSLVAMHMELGDDRGEAHARADRLMRQVRH
jgi:hypothetical protein